MRERLREGESRVLSGSGGSVCVVTETMREPSETTFLYSHGLPRDLFAISRFPEGWAREPRSYVGMWSALLERSGRAADVRGQRRGPAWRRAPATGAQLGRLRFLLLRYCSPFSVSPKHSFHEKKKTLKNGGSTLFI